MATAQQGVPASTRMPATRQADVQAGIRLELVTLGWMTVEALIAIGAGVVARSVLHTAFGLDSVIELVTGGVLLWRLRTEARGQSLLPVERAERRAAWVTGSALVLLCGYIVITAAGALLTHSKPDGSPIGVLLALVAVVGMPLLARAKRRMAAQLNSAALRGDAACSMTCAAMAGALLVGLVCTTVLHWWWMDSVAALALLYWLSWEAREALAGAKAGRGACCCAEGAYVD